MRQTRSNEVLRNIFKQTLFMLRRVLHTHILYRNILPTKKKKNKECRNNEHHLFKLYPKCHLQQEQMLWKLVQVLAY